MKLTEIKDLDKAKELYKEFKSKNGLQDTHSTSFELHEKIFEIVKRQPYFQDYVIYEGRSGDRLVGVLWVIICKEPKDHFPIADKLQFNFHMIEPRFVHKFLEKIPYDLSLTMDFDGAHLLVSKYFQETEAHVIDLRGITTMEAYFDSLNSKNARKDLRRVWRDGEAANLIIETEANEFDQKRAFNAHRAWWEESRGHDYDQWTEHQIDNLVFETRYAQEEPYNLYFYRNNDIAGWKRYLVRPEDRVLLDCNFYWSAYDNKDIQLGKYAILKNIERHLGNIDFYSLYSAALDESVFEYKKKFLNNEELKILYTYSYEPDEYPYFNRLTGKWENV